MVRIGAQHQGSNLKVARKGWPNKRQSAARVTAQRGKSLVIQNDQIETGVLRCLAVDLRHDHTLQREKGQNVSFTETRVTTGSTRT